MDISYDAISAISKALSSPTFYIVLSFAILLIICFKMLRVKVIPMLDTRIGAIELEIIEAQKLYQDALDTLESTNENLSAMRINGERLLTNTCMQMNKMKEDLEKKIKEIEEEAAINMKNKEDGLKNEIMTKLVSEIADSVIRDVLGKFNEIVGEKGNEIENREQAKAMGINAPPPDFLFRDIYASQIDKMIAK